MSFPDENKLIATPVSARIGRLATPPLPGNLGDLSHLSEVISYYRHLVKVIMNIDDLLNAAKTKLDLKSDYALAKRLDTSTSRIGHWRTGQRTPDEQACFQLAEILEESPAAIIAMVRLGKEKEPSKIEFWKRQATRYAIGAGYTISWKRKRRGLRSCV